METARMVVSDIIIDCADAGRLAQFWSRLRATDQGEEGTIRDTPSTAGGFRRCRLRRSWLFGAISFGLRSCASRRLGRIEF